MLLKILAACASILTSLILSSHLSAATLSCEGGIVSIGDSRLDLQAKCGEPVAKESREEEIIEKINREKTRRVFMTVDEWTYNFGPAQFMRIVTLKDGKVADIATRDYGYSRPAQRQERDCTVSPGARSHEVAAQCGAPS